MNPWKVQINGETVGTYASFTDALLAASWQHGMWRARNREGKIVTSTVDRSDKRLIYRVRTELELDLELADLPR